MSVTAITLPTQETHPQPRSGPRPMTCLPLGDDQYRVSSGRYERAESTYIWDDLLQSCECLDWQLYGGPERQGRAGFPLDHPERLCKHGHAVRAAQQRAAALGSQQPTPAQIVSAAAPIAAPVADPSKPACRSCHSTRWSLNAHGVCAACYLFGTY